MARLTRQESRARTCQLLQQSAMTLVVERGYDGASVTDIAEHAGFSKGALFANFDSKEALLFSVLRSSLGKELTMLEEMIVQLRNGQKAEALLEPFFAIIDEDPTYIRYNMQMLMYANRTPEFAKEYMVLLNNYLQVLASLLEAFFASIGKKPPLPPKEIGDRFVALAHGLVLQNKPRIGTSIKEMLEILIAIAEPVTALPGKNV